MAGISLRGVIDDTLIRRFTGLSSSSSSAGSSITSALSGGGSQATIQSGLRVGARTFATAVQGLNTGIAFLNTAKSTLGQLGEITDDMIALATRSSKSTSSNQERRNADSEFQRLGNKFQKVVENAKLGEREFLTVEGISEYLTLIGLDKEKSDSISDIFKQFEIPAGDDALASEEAQGPRPARIPATAYSATAHVTVAYDQIFDDQVNITTRPNAYKVLNDLNALREQISSNEEALDKGIDVIIQNIDLVRASGLAFLDLSNQIGSDADAAEVASQLRDRIRKDAPAALAQAENLENIVVAALSLSPEVLGLSKK